MNKLSLAALMLALFTLLIGCEENKSSVEAASTQKLSVSDESFEQIVAAANSNNPEAQFKLGEIYRLGKNSIPKNDGEALNWFLKSAAQGNQDAQMAAAKAYLEGAGTNKNLPEAFNWFAKVTEKSGPHVAEAHFQMAEAYKSGSGVPKSISEAISHYKAAAELGNSAAKSEMAKLSSEK